MVPLVQGHALAAYVPRLGFENAVEALVLFAGEAAASWIDFADVTDHVHPGSPRLFAQTREWLGRVHEVASAVVTVGHDGESAEVVSDREDAMQRVREAVDCVERVITEIRETGNSSSLGSLLGAERSRDWLLALVG
jgi:hypothetical protein